MASVEHPAPEAAEPDEGPDAPEREWVEIVFTVEPNYAGWRLDKYLCHKIRRLSRTKVQQVIENSLVSEKKLKASSLVTTGMKIVLRRQLLVEPTVPPPEALREVFCDAQLLVIDKPAGLPIHPTARYHHGTLVGQLKVRYGPDFQAHPAHRLDRETSGLLVCGRTLESSQHLSRSFVSGEVHKEYLAIVEGTPPEHFEVDAPIAEGTDLVRIAVRIDHETGKPAKTRFTRLQQVTHDGLSYALVRCEPETGRQHQIRIHASTAGYPLVGDKMYGPGGLGVFDRFTARTMTPDDWRGLKLPRHALHAARLTLTHPTTRQPVTFDSALPDDLTGFLKSGPALELP